MKITVDWPSRADLIENEIYTLAALGNNSSLSEVQFQLASDATKAYSLYKNKDINKVDFSFSSWIEFPKSRTHSVRKACVECLIKLNQKNPKNYALLTYSFGLFRLTDQETVHLIKKFHIDFINSPNTARLPLHPIFHLQSPGELSPMLRDINICDDHLEPSLSEPRLYCAPTTLALLVDFLLREFVGDNKSFLTKLTRDNHWYGLIKRSEDLVLEPYFRACSGFFNDRNSKREPEKRKLFSQDFVYGL